MPKTSPNGQTRQQILRAALKRFANGGYAATSVQQIMRDAAERAAGLREKLVEILSALFEYFCENRELMRISFATAFASPGEVPSGLRYLDKCRRNFEFVHSLMNRALAEGELDGRFDSRELAFGFYGETNLYLMAHLTML